MSTSNIDVIRSGYAAFERGDLPAMFAILDPEAEFYQSSELPWGGRYRGHTQIAEFFRKLSTSVESKVSAERFVEAGDQIVQIGRTRGKVRATGKAFDVPEVHVWTFRQGKIVRFEAYLDHATLLPALN
jgi:uncharacterized protein